MGVELIDSVLIESFKQQLTTIDFLASSDHAEIKSLLDSFSQDNKQRPERSRIAGEIWKYFFKQSLNSITSNLRVQ